VADGYDAVSLYTYSFGTQGQPLRLSRRTGSIGPQRSHPKRADTSRRREIRAALASFDSCELRREYRPRKPPNAVKACPHPSSNPKQRMQSSATNDFGP